MAHESTTGLWPLADISASYVHDEVVHLVIISKICLKPPCEEYTAMG